MPSALHQSVVPHDIRLTDRRLITAYAQFSQNIQKFDQQIMDSHNEFDASDPDTHRQ